MTLPPLIDNDADLTALCETLARSERVAIDTEFVRDRTYFPTLCLLQICSDDQLALVDPLNGLDLAPLFEALARPGLLKVLHAARQDLEIFFLLSGKVPQPVFDTQVAAACLGYGEQLSYSRLVAKTLDLDLGDSHARTDWTRRPLREAQLNYAADDVRYLLQICRIQQDALRSSKREAWLLDEFRNLGDKTLYAPQPELAYRKIRAQKNLDGLRRARLAALADWRERIAMEKDLPRRWVVADKPLLDMASLDGSDADALTAIAGAPAKLVKKEASRLCAVLSSAGDRAGDFEETAKRPTAAENRLLKKMTTLVKAEATRLETSPSLLATRSDLSALIRGERADSALLHGWRADLIGSKLLALMETAAG